jgi:hypothetical protein
MSDALFLVGIFAALILLAFWFPKITHFMLITLFVSAICAAAAFLWLGAGVHF